MSSERQDKLSIYKNQLYFYSQFKSEIKKTIQVSIKNNQIVMNKFNRSRELPHWKLQNIFERN